MTASAESGRTSFVRATGRTRKAGYWICGGGTAVALSAFLPWVSVGGLYSTHQSGGGIVLLLAIGGLLAYSGARILQGRVSRFINIALWVLAAVDVLLVIGLFAAQHKLNTDGSGIISVQPAIGFYLALGGLIASMVGTVLVHTIRRKKMTGAQPFEAGR